MRTFLIAAALALSAPSFVLAEPITYILDYTNVDMGFQGNVYLNGSITLTLTGDTRDVVSSFDQSGPLYLFQGPMTFAIAGGPSGTAYYQARIVYQAYSGVFMLYTDIGGGGDLFSRQGLAVPPFINYQLKTNYTALPTVTEIESAGITVGSPTSGGIGVFGTATSKVAFRSIVTPEPSSLVLAALGGVGVVVGGIMNRRHSRHAA